MSRRTLPRPPVSASPASLLTERFHPVAAVFPLLEGPAFEDLIADVKANGLREPIIEYQGQILDGRNRYRACVAAKIKPVFSPYVGHDAVGYVLSANLHRRHLNESQRGMVMARIATLKPGRPAIGRQAGVLQADAAKLLTIGVRTGQRAKLVIEKGVPNLVRRVEQGEIPVAIAAQVAVLDKDVQEKLADGSEAELRGAVKRDARSRKEQKLAAGTAQASVSLGSQLYSVIYADPPWRFEPFSRVTGLDRAADNHYPTLTVSDICKIKPPAAKDCALFLWATAPMLVEALSVVTAWGFTYKSHFIWAKDRIGTGYWTRNKHELLLIATRGDVPAPAPGDQFDSIMPADVGKHSEKPFLFAEMIEEMFPTARPLEMFARGPRAGWDVWGNEAEFAA